MGFLSELRSYPLKSFYKYWLINNGIIYYSDVNEHVLGFKICATSYLSVKRIDIIILLIKNQERGNLHLRQEILSRKSYNHSSGCQVV
jgi:hypothetical protein